MVGVHVVKAYKKGNGLAINIIGATSSALGMSAGSYELSRDGDHLILKQARSDVLMTIAGIDCFTWQDVAWVGKCMHENGYVPDGKGGVLAGSVSGSPHGENGGDEAVEGGASSLF